MKHQTFLTDARLREGDAYDRLDPFFRERLHLTRSGSGHDASTLPSDFMESEPTVTRGPVRGSTMVSSAVCGP